MFTEGNLYFSYKHIEAKTPEELEKLMLQIQVKAKRAITFTAPTFVKGKWITWFNFDYSQDIRAKDKINLDNNNK